MTDTLTPRPEVVQAIRDLKAVVDGGAEQAELSRSTIVDLLGLLPADLVAAATVKLPTEPGLYVGPSGTRGPVWRVDTTRDFAPHREGGYDLATPADGPFRRLVAEGDGPTHVFTGAELYQVYLDSPRRPRDSFEDVARFVNTYTSKEA